ncbi:MAG: hypothetical protein PHI34_02940 [Acidobacteriota bacterium]|nr:hypothetical protein [Acidobacteriota bacterium]
MNNFDKNYLKLQFELRIHESNGSQFQIFFEGIMGAAFSDFQKVRPYGNKGDGGNDGYRPDDGIYYQIYSPQNPTEKEAEAALKLKKDFEKLKINWDEISRIRVFYFVYNDKFNGVGIEIDGALAELKRSNYEIEFKRLLAKDLEEIFFNLKTDQIMALRFSVDSTSALRITRESLAKLEVYLDRGNASFVLKGLENNLDIVKKQSDETLLADWEILQCRALQQLERIKEAKQKYESLSIRYPEDPRPLLYLAELYLNEGAYEKNAELLREAGKIDSKHWLLRLENILRDLHLNIKFDTDSIDQETFPTEPNIKANFYRLYALSLLLEKDLPLAWSFIEKALFFNPDKLATYITKLILLENEDPSTPSNKEEMRTHSLETLAKIDAILSKTAEWGELSPRNQAIFNVAKMRYLLILDNLSELERLAKESFDQILLCYFNLGIDQLLSNIITFVRIPQDDFNKLLTYVKESENSITDLLAKKLISQFIVMNTLFTEGRIFFGQKKKENFLPFINDLENKKIDDVWAFLKDDPQFAVTVADCVKEMPELRRKIVENLPDDINIKKDMLLLLLNYDESNIEEAFRILQKIDFKELSYLECQMVLRVARKKKAWEFVVLIVEKLLVHEKKEDSILKLEIELFFAHLNLERLTEAIRIGEKILANNTKLSLLDNTDKESVLAQTVLARLRREEFSEAMRLIETYPNIPETSEFKEEIEAVVYLRNREARKAIASIVAGMKILKVPTPEQYAKLFLQLNEIDHLIKFSLDSLPAVDPESFVKFVDVERWYYVGDSEELDAIKIPSSNEKYEAFIGKKVNGPVVFRYEYRPNIEHKIEKILPIDKYVFAQSVYHFTRLAAEGVLPGVEMIDVPHKGDSIDLKNIISFFGAKRENRDSLFVRYCNNELPLAFLAVSEDGLIGAIAKIRNEEKGFVRFSSGDPAEIGRQKGIAQKILEGKPFYIDGTSAFILSETSVLQEVFKYLPNLKVPQSVITMLLKIKESVGYVPGQAGGLQYARGKLSFSEYSPAQGEALRKKLDDSIKLLESKPKNIAAISLASKVDDFIEQKIPPELCDACILAQNEGIPVLTEDYLYLKANEAVTGKKAPGYSAAFALIKTLYEMKRISFEAYLTFFTYLSVYRFRFLPFSVQDIENTVFGDGIIKIVQSKRIRALNFPLTLSEEYGVPFRVAFRMVVMFLKKILTDDSIIPEAVGTIFAEILHGFPSKMDKKMLGKMFVYAASRLTSEMRHILIVGTMVKAKVDRLAQFMEVYRDTGKIIMPRIVTFEEEMGRFIS